MRVSQVVLTIVLLDDFDAPQPSDPLVFVNDPEGTAPEKAAKFLTGLGVVGTIEASDQPEPVEV